jgi:hypothetical protein
MVFDVRCGCGYGGRMLQVRLAGDPGEARAFLDALAAGGVEVAVGTVKDRGGFSHVYATVRMPDYTAVPAGPVWVAATSGRALEGRRRAR